jgi:PAS domain S-box-containing protein
MAFEASEDGDEHQPLASGAPHTSEPVDVRSAPHAHTTSAVLAALRDLADRSSVATVVVEGSTHVLRYANPAFRSLTGTESRRLLGTALSDLVPPTAGGVIELLSRVREQQTTQVDVEIFSADGETRRLAPSWRVSAWPIETARGERDADHLAVQLRDASVELREQRRHAAMLAELREVNERLVLASLREQALRDHAQAASAAKSAFLATMSHEFRTPLTAIMLYETLLSDGITGPITEAQRVQLGRIKACSDHLLALIDEILTLSRLEAGKEVVRLGPVRVADLIDMTTALIGPMASAKGLTLNVDVAPASTDAPPLTLKTDGLKVRQILLNLLGNAVKYSERGGITLAVRERGDTIVFDVRDTGIGIPPEYLEQIFDVFWQVRQSATRTVEGAGLGLSVSRRFAQLLGGDVTAESVAGAGSTFTLWLPKHSAVLGAEGNAGA